MVSDADDLTIEYIEDDVVVLKELDKRILTRRGGWVTIIYKYRDWDRRKDDYGPVKYSIRRYCKRNDVYRQQSKFNISNVKQAKDLVAVLEEWTGDEDG